MCPGQAWGVTGDGRKFASASMSGLVGVGGRSDWPPAAARSPPLSPPDFNVGIAGSAAVAWGSALPETFSQVGRLRNLNIEIGGRGVQRADAAGSQA